MAVLSGFAICLRYRQGGGNRVNDLRGSKVRVSAKKRHMGAAGQTGLSKRTDVPLFYASVGRFELLKSKNNNPPSSTRYRVIAKRTVLPLIERKVLFSWQAPVKSGCVGKEKGKTYPGGAIMTNILKFHPLKLP